MINTASEQASKVISIHSFAEVIENTVMKQKSLHATRSFEQEAAICTFHAGKIYTTPNYLTVQTGIDKHITLEPEFLQYSNHSCNPNIFFDTKAMQVIALKHIEPNEELCFFYPSTEIDMAQPFLCYCGSKNCLQNIRGAKHIPSAMLARYRLTEFIKEQVKQSS